MSRLDDELRRVFGEPPVAPRAVVRVQVGSGQGVVAGREEGDRFVDAGAELVVLDSEGTTTGTLAAAAALLDLEPVAVLPPTSSAGWKEQLVEVRQLLRDAGPHRYDPEGLVHVVGDPALGRLLGLLDRLTERRTPVLLGGGTAVAVAALLMTRLRPQARELVLAGSRPADPVGVLALTATQLVPLLDLGLGPEAADIAVAVVRTGLDLIEAGRA
jgi:nicotinate-nucleotide--dimethylbenzimidazole phosphoribosyltransferase